MLIWEEGRCEDVASMDIQGQSILCFIGGIGNGIVRGWVREKGWT